MTFPIDTRKQVSFKNFDDLAVCDGSSIWCNSKGLTSKVEWIRLKYESVGDCDWVLVYVKHNLPWEVYTDRGFENSVSRMLSKKLGFDVKATFTEQGMQNRGIASLEFGKEDVDRFVEWMNNHQEEVE